MNRPLRPIAPVLSATPRRRRLSAAVAALAVADRPTDLLASVEPDALVLRDADDRESRMPLPEDAVHISVAPFREQTHECHFHSLTTCIGELSDAEVRITLTATDVQLL